MSTGGIGTCAYHLSKLFVYYGHKVSVISANNILKDEVVFTNGYTNYLTFADSNEEFRKKALVIFDQYFSADSVDFIESPEVGACAIEIKKKYPLIPLIVRVHTPGVMITKISRYYQSFWVKLRYVIGALIRGRLDFGYWNIVDRNRENDIEFQICNIADQILSPSIALKFALHRMWKIENLKIQISQNPYLFSKNITSNQILNREKIICFVGKLSVLKGVYNYSKALKKILSIFPDYKAIIIGRDEIYMSSHHSFTDYMKLELDEFIERVAFKGVLSYNEIKTILLKSRILVVPSLWENNPMVVFEGISAGCTIVATNQGGTTEIIQDGENGLLINPFLVDNIVSQIRKLIENDALRVSMATKALEKLLVTHSIERQKVIVDLYGRYALSRKLN
jgi:glycogen(starch) synthase